MGKIIVFEGLDCSFKETNSKALESFLKNNGESAKLFSFPVYKNDSSFFVREYLKGSYGYDPALVDGKLGAAFYFMDQFHIWKTQIEKYYKEGYTIILDRFWTSSLIFQGCKQYRLNKDGLRPNSVSVKDINMTINDIANTALHMFNLPMPDVVIKMTMHLENMLELVKAKGSTNDIHENNLTFLKTIHAAYNDERIVFNKNDMFKKVYCSKGHTDISKKGILLSRSSVFNQIKDIVLPILRD